MIKNLEHVKCIDTQYRVPDFPKLCAHTESSSCEPTIGNGFKRRHRLTLTLFVEFDASQAQYDAARDSAKKHLANSLYGEMLSRLVGIQHTVSGGDTNIALSMINKLKRDLVESLHGI